MILSICGCGSRQAYKNPLEFLSSLLYYTSSPKSGFQNSWKFHDMFGFGGRKTKTLFAQAYVLSHPTVSHKTRKDPLISRERVPEQQKKRWRTYVSGELGDEYKTPLSSFSSLLFSYLSLLHYFKSISQNAYNSTACLDSADELNALPRLLYPTRNSRSLNSTA
jgi:hypothetical protein